MLQRFKESMILPTLTVALHYLLTCPAAISFSWSIVTARDGPTTTLQRRNNIMKNKHPYRLALVGDNNKENMIESSSILSLSSSSEGDDVDFDSLIDMDVIMYSLKNGDNDKMYLGAIQEDGTLSPLSTWTTEPAFGSSVEFLVDEEDRFVLTSRMDDIQIHRMVPETQLSYGSRQCHRGVGNPHGEESEILYYVDQDVIDKYKIEIAVKPHLEILW